MKKFIIVSLAFLLILFTPFASFAQNSDDLLTIMELYGEWETNGYPDNIGHVVYDDISDKYVVGLVDSNEAAIKEIEARLSSSEDVIFEKATYSYNQMLKVQNEITEQMQGQEIFGIGLGWTTIDGEVRGFGESGHEMRIVLTTSEDSYDNYVEMYQSEYGDMVYVEVGSPAVVDTMDIYDDSLVEDSTNSYLPLIVVLGIITFAVVFIGRNKFVLVKQAANGDNVVESTSVGRKEVISAVKESGIKPRDNVYKAILKKIKE